MERTTEATAPIRERLCVPAFHPSLPGHFPGAPIVPGVVVLSLVVATLRARLGPFSVRGFRSVKFVHPLQPDEPFELEAHEARPGSLRFRCCSSAGPLVEGSLEIER